MYIPTQDLFNHLLKSGATIAHPYASAWFDFVITTWQLKQGSHYIVDSTDGTTKVAASTADWLCQQLGAPALTQNTPSPFHVAILQDSTLDINAISARELHTQLGVTREFSKWIKERIASLGLVEGCDYGVFAKNGENLSGGRPKVDYAVTINVAKHLAMVEKTARGQEARQYFIDVERQLTPKTLSVEEMRMLVMQGLEAEVQAQKEELKALALHNANLEETTKFANACLSSDAGYTTTSIAKSFAMSARALNVILHELRIIFKPDPKGRWYLYQPYCGKGYDVDNAFFDPTDRNMKKPRFDLRWTIKGRKFIYGMLSVAGYKTINELASTTTASEIETLTTQLNNK
jgi:anti-repressor protein